MWCRSSYSETSRNVLTLLLSVRKVSWEIEMVKHFVNKCLTPKLLFIKIRCIFRPSSLGLTPDSQRTQRNC
jgi:hypothetical protein